MIVEQKEFCANDLCPHHSLPMNDELHYHKEDKGVIITRHGILNTDPYSIRKRTYKRKRKWFIFTERITETYIEKKYFCEMCQRAIDMAQNDPVV